MILPYATTLLVSAASPLCADMRGACMEASTSATASATAGANAGLAASSRARPSGHGVAARLLLQMPSEQPLPLPEQAPGRCVSPLSAAEPAVAPADGVEAAASETQAETEGPGDTGEGGAATAGQDNGDDCRGPDQPHQNIIVVEGRTRPPPGDPLVDFNNATFGVSQAVDQALVGPVADVYENDVPSPVRKGLRNFFRNLLEPITALNYLLQLKPGKAFETLGRFALNTTVGFAGLFDVAKREPFNLPYRRNSLGDTLGYYGVGPGPFLVLPLIGATTLRDLVGTTLDQAVLPFAVGAPFDSLVYAVPAYTVNSLEFRINFDERLAAINDSVDPYTSMRVSYLCQREAHIASLKGKAPPRDCSIEALFGPQAAVPGEAAPGDAAGTAAGTGQASPGADSPNAALPVAESPAVATPVEPVVQVEDAGVPGTSPDAAPETASVPQPE